MDITNSEFLSRAYGREPETYGWTTSFRADPTRAIPSVWGGSAWTGTLNQKDLIDQRGEDNNFFSVAVMKSDTGKRSKTAFHRLAVLLADDVNHKDLLSEPSYILETSPTNYQIGVVLDPKDPDTKDAGLIDAVLQAMIAQKMVKADSSGNNIVRYGRLPVGTNTKSRESGPFTQKMFWCDFDCTYSLADAVGCFGLDLDVIRGQVKQPRKELVAGPSFDISDAIRAITNPNFNERSYHDALLRLTSGMRATGMHKGAVVNLVRGIAEPFKPSNGPELDRYNERFGSELLRMVDGADKFAPEPVQFGQSRLVNHQQLEAQLTNASWLVKNLVPANSMGMIFGASGTFKSFIALDLCLHALHGLRWCEKKTEPGSFVYIAAEGGAGIVKRVNAWHAEHQLPVKDNFYYMTVPVLLGEQEEIDILKSEIEALPTPPSLIIIDTLSQTFNGEENSSSDVGNYLRMINTHIRAPFEATVIVVHHTGHNAAERPRGSSAITANLDFLLGCFRPDGEGMSAKLTTVKMKDGDKLDDLWFNLERVVLGRDADDEELSSLVASYHDDVKEVSESFRASKFDSTIWELLNTYATVNEMQFADMLAQQTGVALKSAHRTVRRRLDTFLKMGSVKMVGPKIWSKA